jgi:hypothetical protein
MGVAQTDGRSIAAPNDKDLKCGRRLRRVRRWCERPLKPDGSSDSASNSNVPLMDGSNVDKFSMSDVKDPTCLSVCRVTTMACENRVVENARVDALYRACAAVFASVVKT